ncbi:hypothetical protein [Ensifer soli]|uniref:hypothetical protein n=1 Tax=Ciceribacter sp. sgz301302 TaxID=3342379 RepID=UPI0035BA4601
MVADTVIVSLTTIDSRIGHVGKVLKSIYEQSFSPRKIFLNISEDSFMLDKGIDKNSLPDDLIDMQNHGMIEINFTRNIGPYRKIFDAQRLYGGSFRYIVTADDDVVYPRDWLKGLVEAAAGGGHAITAYRCRAMITANGGLAPYNKWPMIRDENTGFGDVPLAQRPLFTFATGRGGILYSTDIFSDLDLLETLRQQAPAQDDVVLKFISMSQGVPVHRVPMAEAGTRGREFPTLLIEGEESAGLFNQINISGGNDAAIGRVVEKLRELTGFDYRDLL